MKRTAAAAVIILALFARPSSQTTPGREWPVYGGDAGGTRFSPLARITRDNVATLVVAWRYHTGEPPLDLARQPSLQVTPIVVDNVMYISTPLGKVMALDPATGSEIWRYDARVNPRGGYGDFASRGVATWVDSTLKPGAPCRRRIYVATMDARLVSLDGTSGYPCVAFGVEGTVGLREGLRIRPAFPSAYQVTSPPIVVGDLVMTGAAIADNSRPAPASGEVRAFDVRSGALRWTWDPIPQDPKDPAHVTWRNGSAAKTGAANVWSIMTADPARDLLFVPTSSPAPDYYGALRLGDNRYANSIVALRASTAASSGTFKPCTTTSGTMTTPPRRRL
jgi:quinoprotein glucose dehydrogenase